LGAERSAERIEAFLGEIYARISAHFALEEKDMQARAYPERPAHKADHERLLDDLRDIMDEVHDQGVLDDAGFRSGSRVVRRPLQESRRGCTNS
jgi:hemerythrin